MMATCDKLQMSDEIEDAVLFGEDGSFLEISASEEIEEGPDQPTTTSTPKKRDKKHECAVCHKQFARANELTRHMLIHSDAPHCRICGKVFDCTEERNEHIAEKHSVMCTSCGLKYKTDSILREHIVNTHSEQDRTYKCPFPDCKKAFVRKTHLAMHMNVHNDHKPYKCPSCPRSYACILCIGSLRAHKKICFSSKKYTCSRCNDKYASKSSLKDHVNAKHHRKQHVCAYGKAFAWRSGLTRHKKSC